VARARLLKPGFFANETLAELPFEARLLFAGLWTLADRAGRLEDRAKRIRAALFPYDDVDVDELLDGLAVNGFIVRYAAGDLRLIQVLNFTKHQHPHIREPVSVLPGPDGAEPSSGTLLAPDKALPRSMQAPYEHEADPSEAEALTGVLNRSPYTEAETEAEAETDDDDAPLAQVRRRLRQSGISISPALDWEIEQALDESPLECVLHCIDEAVRYGKPSLVYVQVVRQRHLEDGCPPEDGLTRTEKLARS
jgi:hypothetical protein